jgi:hypothetical protein
MNTKYLLIECPALLIQAKRIFGEDIATNAWFAEQFIDTPHTLNLDYVKLKLEKIANDFMDVGNENIALLDAYVVIEFCQERKVFFSTSEWGHIELADEETVCYS